MWIIVNIHVKLVIIQKDGNEPCIPHTQNVPGAQLSSSGTNTSNASLNVWQGFFTGQENHHKDEYGNYLSPGCLKCDGMAPSASMMS